MAYSSDPHILSQDDVLPAEGVQAAVDIANANAAALYVQHDRKDAEHLDAGPFLVGRVLFKGPTTALGELHGIVVQQTGYVHRVILGSDADASYYTSVVIDMEERVTLLGAHASVRFTPAAVSTEVIAVSCSLLTYQRLIVEFHNQITWADVSHVHVLIRGTLA